MKSNSNYKKEVEEIFNLINEIRQNPVNYSLALEKFRSAYKNKDFFYEKNAYISTQEGIPALEELITYMEKQKPKNKLKLETGLSLASKDFCDQTDDSVELNDLLNKCDLNKAGSKYGQMGSTISALMTNLITNDSDKNLLFLILSDGDETRYYRDNLMDNKFRKIGIHIKKFSNDDAPLALIYLMDEYTTKSQYENDEKQTNKDFENIVSSSAKISLDKNRSNNDIKNKNNDKVEIQDDDDDDDFNLPPGVLKVEKKSKVVVEGNNQYVVTKTITHMEDGSINTEIKKEKK